SLDQFKPHNWYDPSIWPTYSNYSRWNGNYNFSEMESAQKELEDNNIRELVKNYDQLYGINEAYYYARPGNRPLAAPRFVRNEEVKMQANEISVPADKLTRKK